MNKIEFDELKSRVNISVMLITPEKARDFLTKNISNRRMDKNAVNVYKRVLESKQFVLSNDAICFGLNGTLLNGQHRLQACVETRIPFVAFVAQGMPLESYVVMDNGKNRSASDVLYVQDVPKAALIAAGIRRFINLNRQYLIVGDMSGSKTKISNSEIEDMYNSNKVFWNDVAGRSANISNHGRYHNLIVGSEVFGMVAYLHLTLNHPLDKCFDFFEEISGRQKPTNEVITLLQDRLRESKNFVQRRLPSFVIQKLIIKAWNAYITGKTYSRFFYNEKTDKELWFV